MVKDKGREEAGPAVAVALGVDSVNQNPPPSSPPSSQPRPPPDFSYTTV